MDGLFGIGLFASLASTAYTFYSQRQAAAAAEKQAKYNAKYNEQVQKQAAEEALRERKAQEREDRRSAVRERARIESEFAAAGLVMTGSPLYALEEQAKVDEVMIANDTRREQSNFMKALQAATTERKMSIASAGQMADAANTQATAGLIGGLGGAAMSSAMFYGGTGGADKAGSGGVNKTMANRYSGVYG